MTKILEVFGDADYSVISYKDAIKEGTVNAAELWNKSWEAENALVFEEGDTYFEYEAHAFKDIDPLFIKFIHDDIEDYDMAKHHTFFVLEDK